MGGEVEGVVHGRVVDGEEGLRGEGGFSFPARGSVGGDEADGGYSVAEASGFAGVYDVVERVGRHCLSGAPGGVLIDGVTGVTAELEVRRVEVQTDGNELRLGGFVGEVVDVDAVACRGVGGSGVKSGCDRLRLDERLVDMLLRNDGELPLARDGSLSGHVRVSVGF